ncbi:cytochrome C [Salinisphaera orenii MK-B5]|mgnify:CR=1 FL=1|uniref:Cytochrome C n=1 Tax=Salinisphaera orenii MK-B5 TaxID=856730 RepID=A0A423PHC9_9GAMM|nr:cytochrome c1 [Salinisphaera orenii]ROO25022.1 cytochrome C [Salinisphaera orenii MK-B5]
MKRSLLLALLVMLPISVWAAEGSVPFEFDPNLDNQASLQRGAKLFMNYCSGCHSLQYMRYNRIAEDLEIPRDVVENNLIMTGGKIHSTIQGTMSKEQAGDWFGKAPPDLSLIARQRGADWIYSFLLSFYLDDSRPNGVNNLVMANTAMPHVLAPLQGYQVHEESGGHDGESEGGHGDAGPALELVQEGQLNPAEYRSAVGDITNFLVYAGEPVKLTRASLGFKVIVFLILFTGLAYMLKREFWRDVH